MARAADLRQRAADLRQEAVQAALQISAVAAVKGLMIIAGTGRTEDASRESRVSLSDHRRQVPCL